MMSQNRQPKLELVQPTDVLGNVYDTLDQLHNAASSGEQQAFSGLNNAEMLKMLQEIIYMAQETIDEIENQRTWQQPVLRIIEPKAKRQEKVKCLGRDKRVT